MEPTPMLRDRDHDDAPPTYEQAMGLCPTTVSTPPPPPPDCSPPPYRPPYCLVSSPSPRHTFDMDMMEMPATMHPTTGAYFDNGWKWTFALLVVAILGIIFLAVVFTVVINRDSANITTGTQASSG
ncbi:protein UL42 [Human betaherpesvirus 5]|uniref:Protein UL42 n=5 Tax=Human cytomegalovirus TaxID=10359 RepID=UL42_HCMVA|nr:protein UL42 [Human betaherpesvirus 5]F5HHZ3.1 RecName: Full=Protein UL42 [Human herpesvirus 5 strain Merlin]P16815.2 RecName: Full=Protein UL42 [Human herpesvirus 5 strain AD169]AMD82376.1 UL42 [synthetic construct]AVT50300.1 protein UL42 [synthetic human betaherpesvirus 5]WNA12741.1 protein UL42 [Cytomegalovirus humanbeta5]AAC40321.1 glycoprotein UL42 [Human betaherpesvirus 5]AAR31606.1 protein UL42 [Human betaherpesvirus 5]